MVRPLLAALAVLAGLPAAPLEAEDASKVDLYVGGRQYGSVAEYQQEKKTLMALSPASTITGRGAAVDFPNGRTLIIGQGGRVIEQKGVTVSPETTLTPVISAADTLAGGAREVRVAGVTPSVGEAVAAFRSGDDRRVPIPVSSPAELDEQLRRRLRAAGRPILLISDKKTVRVMELQTKE